MEQSNNKNIIIVLLGVIIVILGSLCVLFATGVLSINKEDDKLKEEISALPEWGKYVLNKKLTKIVYINPTDEVPDDDYDKCPRTTISKEDLTKIFKEMANNKLIKTDGGIGFIGSCYPGLEIEYDNKKINITSGVIFPDENDPEFIKLLDKSAELLDVNGSIFYHYVFDNFDLGKFVSENIIDK